MIHREWGWYRYFGHCWTLWSHLHPRWSIQTAREYTHKLMNGPFNFHSETMIWVWFVSQNVRRIFWNVHRLVALLNVFWNAIELGLCAVIVSSLLDWNDGGWTRLIHLLKLVRVILIALMAVKVAKIRYASVTWVLNCQLIVKYSFLGRFECW